MNVRRWIPVALLIFACGSIAHAHEIKVFASRQSIPEGEGKTTIYLSWGHRMPVDDLVNATTIERYDLLAPDGTANALTKADISLQTNSVALKSPGVHQVAVARKVSMYTYVFDEEGERVLKLGSKSSITSGKIDVGTKSQQFAKALIVVGEPTKEPVKAVGQMIEIVPLDPPSLWKQNHDIRFQVFFDGKPLSVATIHARPVNFKPDEAWAYATTSNRKGEFTVRPTVDGTWVLKVNHKRIAPEKNRPEYDEESYTTSLSLEIKP